jgi:hypothetical protein
MAKAENKFDQYFRDKLVDHEEKPSRLVWERLENQLNKKKPTGFLYLKIAATVLLSLGISYTIWQFVQENEPAPELISNAIDNSILEQEPEEQSSITFQEAEKQHESPQKNETNNSVQNQVVPREKQAPKQTVPRKTEDAKVLLAQADTESSSERINEISVDIPDLTIPELNIREAIASIEEDESVEELVEYKIIIKSKGLKDEPKKQNIIEGIESNVNKIGGLLTKVEQGFADLQDAKDNLFASNTPRKERSK